MRPESARVVWTPPDRTRLASTTITTPRRAFLHRAGIALLGGVALAASSRRARADEPGAVWLQNTADAVLWSDPGSEAVAFATIPAGAGYFRLDDDPMEDGRVRVFYPGDDSGVEAGDVWVDRAELLEAQAPPPGPLTRPPPPLISETPRPLPPGSGRVFRRVTTDQPVVALTLDDFIELDALDILAGRNARATLFLTGAWVRSRPETAIRAVADGHELGNHTWDHPFLTRGPGFSGTVREMDMASAAIQEVTGQPPIPAFRPPYGRWDGSVLAAVAQAADDLYLWDVDSGGYRRSATPEHSAQTVLAHATAGSIIVMHAHDRADRLALGTVIDGLRDRGLQPGRLSDLQLSVSG